ncbi:MAG: InlB B-repeat-containing protein [Methanosarcinales archaeon]|nr:InlB B-repeat-containing protein [Methanosarcinales archaeon]
MVSMSIAFAAVHNIGETVGDVSDIPAESPFTDFSVKIGVDDYYVEPINTYYDGNPTFILITQDSANYSHGEDTQITHNGSVYDVKVILLTNTSHTFPRSATPGDEVTINAALIQSHFDLSITFHADHTYFFDEGNYLIHAGYDVAFMLPNTSLVGLNKEGQPPATIYKSPILPGNSVFPNDAYTMMRWSFQGQNFYMENLIFDGLEYNMALNPSSGTQRGNFYFVVSADNFVARDITIQNIGNGTFPTGGTLFSPTFTHNIAIRSVGDITSSNFQRNFENITIKDVRTGSTGGLASSNFSTIQIANSSNNHFKNIDFSQSTRPSGSNTYPIRFEHANPAIMAASPSPNTFAGEIKFSSINPNPGIWIQGSNNDEIRTHQLIVPEAFKFVSLPGAAAAPRIGVLEEVPTTNNANTASFDLSTGYWYVDGSGTAINTQLTGITNRVNTAILRNNLILPPPNIKIVTGTNKEVAQFTIPDIAGAYTGALGFSTNPDVHIVVVEPILEEGVPSRTELTPISSIFESTTEEEYTGFITFAPTSGTIVLPGTNADRIRLSNIDFRGVNWTIEEAADEPSGTAPLMTNFARANSVYNMFTKMGHEVTFLNDDDTVIKIEGVFDGEFATAPANLTRTGYVFVGWKDQEDTIIYTKAEIDIRPVTKDVEYKAAFDAVFVVTFLDDDSTEIVNETVIEGEFATAPADPTKTGYTFSGWRDQADTNIYSKTNIDARPVTEDVTYIAVYEINQTGGGGGNGTGNATVRPPSENNTTSPPPAPPGNGNDEGYETPELPGATLLVILTFPIAIAAFAFTQRREVEE